MSARSTLRLAAGLPAARRVAVERGEVARVWPDVLGDMAGLLFWRSWYAVARLLPPYPPKRVDQCPLCRRAADGAARE